MKASDPSSNGKLETDLNSVNIPSSLVRLGNRKELNMKKLINWIWSNKQAESIVHRPYRMIDDKIHSYNKTHGLPLDQVKG